MSKDVLKDILNDVHKYAGQIVLSSADDKLYLFRGFDVGDWDYSYIFQDMYGEITHMTCVAGFIPLKERFKKEEYESLEHTFYHNIELKTGEQMNCLEAPAKKVNNDRIEDVKILNKIYEMTDKIKDKNIAKKLKENCG